MSVGNELEVDNKPVYFWVNDELKKLDTPFYQRSEIPVGTELIGPAIVLQKDSTTVLPPNVTAKFDEHGNVVIDMKRKIEGKNNKYVASTLEE